MQAVEIVCELASGEHCICKRSEDVAPRRAADPVTATVVAVPDIVPIVVVTTPIVVEPVAGRRTGDVVTVVVRTTHVEVGGTAVELTVYGRTVCRSAGAAAYVDAGRST